MSEIPQTAAPTHPVYWRRAKQALGRRDSVMQAIMKRHPRIALRSRGDAFQTLARWIVGQQISVKAADSVWAKLMRVSPGMQPVERRNADGMLSATHRF